MFITMTISDSLWQLNFSDTVILSTLKDPQFGGRFSAIYISFISTILLIFLNFRHHGNRGQSGVNVNDTVKLVDFKDPMSDARLCLSYKLSYG